MSAKRLPVVVVFCLLLTVVVGPVSPAPTRAIAQREAAPSNGPESADALTGRYGQLPLLFVENRGQTDPQVVFTVQAGAATVYFTPTGVTYALVEPRSADVQSTFGPVLRGDAEGAPPDPEPRRRWAVKLDFVGAKPNVQPVGLEAAEAVVSYFRGRPDEWHTGLGTFRRIVYTDLWPGIDLAYYAAEASVDGQGGQALKYEFVVHPGADPEQIRLAYRGAEGVALNEAGQLEVSTLAGGFTDDVPVAWQDGPDGRTPVAATFNLQPIASIPERATNVGNEAIGFGFRVGAYNPSRTLVLDPVVLFHGGYIGGAGEDRGRDIVVDSAGNAYVTGYTDSDQMTFPVVGGPDLTQNGGRDAFVAKVNATGTALLYAGYIGGAGQDEGRGIAVDGAGNAYVTGGTTSDQATFPVIGGPDLIHNGGLDAFVAKINPAGTALLYAGYLGGAGTGGEQGFAIAVDETGSAYVTGYTDSDQATFPVLGGPDLTYNGGENDAFVAKVNPGGAALVYAGYIGGARGDAGWGIAIDGAGNAHVAGTTESNQASFPVVGGPDLTHNGGGDAFVAKVNSGGTALLYAGYIGGDAYDWGTSIAVDGVGNAYLAGTTGAYSATFPVTGGPDLTHNGDYDAFVAKVNPVGTALLYAGFIGGGAYDWGSGIAVDNAGNAYITGGTQSDQATFPVMHGPDLTYNGGYDAFVAKVNPAGSALLYAGYVGGVGNEWGYGVAVDSAGNAHIAGYASSDQTTFPIVGGPDLTYNGGTYDAFVAKVGYYLPPVLWLPLIMR